MLLKARYSAGEADIDRIIPRVKVPRKYRRVSAKSINRSLSRATDDGKGIAFNVLVNKIYTAVKSDIRKLFSVVGTKLMFFLK